MQNSRTPTALAGTLLALCLGVSPAPASAEEIVVIVNRDNLNAVDAAFVRRVYAGSLKGWPDGSTVVVIEQPESSETHETFCTVVLQRSVQNLKAIWSQNIFTGKGLPPKVASPDDAVKQLVAANRHAIGYIRASQLDDSVKPVAR